MPTAKLITRGLIQNEDFQAVITSNNKLEIQNYFQNIFSGPNSSAASQNQNHEILIDYFTKAVNFCTENLLFDFLQVNIFLGILDEIHKFACQDCFSNMREAYQYMRELLLIHAVNEAPWKLIIFQPEEITKLANFIVENYFRHYRLYKYWFLEREFCFFFIT